MAEGPPPAEIIINLRVITQTGGNTRFTKLRIKTSPLTNVATLRKALAKEAQRKYENLKLSFNNTLLQDRHTLRQCGIEADPSTFVDVFLDNPKDTPGQNLMNSGADTIVSKTTHSSKGSRKRRNEDDDAMSISSKRHKPEMQSSSQMRFFNQNNQGGRDDDLMSCIEPDDEEQPQIDSKPCAPPQKSQRKAEQYELIDWKHQCQFCVGTLKGGKQRNEDAVCKFQANTKHGALTAVAVFDGHGNQYFASIASKLSTKITKAFFARFENEMPLWNRQKWEDGMKQLFTKIHKVIRETFVKMEQKQRADMKPKTDVPVVDGKGIPRHSDGKPIHGGTTATVVVVMRTKTDQYLVTAHVGDSEAVLCKVGDNTKFELCFHGHRALNMSENNRIRALDPKDYPVKLQLVYDLDSIHDPDLLPKVYLPDGTINTRLSQNPTAYNLWPSNIRREPAAYAVTPRFVRPDRVRLANTRSLGDFYAHQYGLTWEPEVNIERLPAGVDYGVIVASDGVWDTWEYLDVVGWLNSVAGKLNQQQVDQFLQKTKECATQLFRNPLVVDDSSVGVILVPAT